MPVRHGESEMVPHRFAFHHFVRIVMTKCEWILRGGAFITNLLNLGEADHFSLFCNRLRDRAIRILAEVVTSKRLVVAGLATTSGEKGTRPNSCAEWQLHGKLWILEAATQEFATNARGETAS